MFQVTRAAGDTWYACGRRPRRPVRLYSSEASYGSFHVLGRRAGKLVFVGEFSGEGGGVDTTVGWFDGRTARSGELAGGAGNEVLDVVVTRAGGMGVVTSTGEDRDTRVGYLAPGRDELALALVGGRYAPGSLAFAGRALTWRRADDGQTRTVPLVGERVTCTAGLTRLEHAGVRVFEVLPDRKARRYGFQADVLAACLPGESTPRELAVTEVRVQDHWDLRSLKRAGARVAFLAGRDGAGTIGADGAFAFRRLRDMTDVYDVAVGATGPLVFAARAYEDRERIVATLDGRRLAPLGGDLQAGSLAVADGRVTWRTTDGVARNVSF